jgi:hypothetical protein
MVRFAPVFYNLIAVLFVVLLARRLGGTKEQGLIAAVTFCCLNWVGQDYFSPQATGSLLYLGLILILVYVFPVSSPMWTVRQRRWLRAQPDLPSGPEYDSNTVIALVGVGVLVLAMVSSHQISPVVAGTTLAGLALLRQIKLRLMWAFCCVAFVAWLSFAAKPYWVGHLDTLVGSVGDVATIAEDNVTRRASASSTSDRSIVLYSRIALAVITWIGAGLVVVIAWAKRRTPLLLLVLLFAPFPMLIVQPYGGEMALRVYFFTLAPCAILLSRAAAPRGRRFTAARAGVLVAVGVLLVPLFITARFGNEAFEQFSDDDVAVVRHLYDVAPAGSTVFVANGQSLMYTTRVSEVGYLYLVGDDPEDSVEEFDDAAEDGPVFVLLTNSQRAYGVATMGRSDDWMTRLAADLEQTGDFTEVARAGEALLLRRHDTSEGS